MTHLPAAFAVLAFLLFGAALAEGSAIPTRSMLYVCSVEPTQELACAPPFRSLESNVSEFFHFNGFRPQPPTPLRPGPTASPSAPGSIVNFPGPAGNRHSARSADGEATRIFSGPNQFPPADFAAYAILVFKSVAGSTNRKRHLMICDAYRRAIPESGPDQQRDEQLVTVWPLASHTAVERIREAPPGEKCEIAVDSYGLQTALAAIRDARVISSDIREEITEERGPFLLAWNPGSEKGARETLILRMDLSDVVLPYQAKNRFEFWVQEIEMRPELWLDGWKRVSIRHRIRENADIYGGVILDFFGGRL